MLYVATLEHAVAQPVRDEPVWAEAVPRWQQLDPASYALADAWDAWRRSGVAASLLEPDMFVLANRRASHESDFAFTRAGASSPSKFVSTLPSVPLSSMLRLTGWVGPMLCVQDGMKTLESAFAEVALLLEGDAVSRIGVVTYELTTAETRVRYFVVTANPGDEPRFEERS